ncbi:MAG: phospholipase D-like domain-containing protein, partial [Cellulomonadaceae bacterium]
MTRTPVSPLRMLRRVALRIVGALAALQALVAGTLIAVDAVQKRRRSVRPFPHLPPLHAHVAGNDTTLYTYGEHLYADMLEHIRGARRTVFLETFIWKDDEVGREFKEAILAAARRGVEVYVVYDGFANLVVPREFLTFPSPVNVVRYPVFRPGILLLNVRRSGRTHRKLLIVDDEVAFVGGYNIGTLYATRWRDTHLRLTGSGVWELRNAFVDFWNTARGENQPILPDPGSSVWEPRVRAARNAPAEMLFPIRGLYLQSIDRARDHVYITQAYFIPDREILEALLAAARRGVDVRVIVPEVSNHVITDWLS